MEEKLYTAEEVAKYVTVSITGSLQLTGSKFTAKEIIRMKEAVKGDLLLGDSMKKSINEYERAINLIKSK